MKSVGCGRGDRNHRYDSDVCDGAAFTDIEVELLKRDDANMESRPIAVGLQIGLSKARRAKRTQRLFTSERRFVLALLSHLR